jgi:hypothetical protein
MLPPWLSPPTSGAQPIQWGHFLPPSATPGGDFTANYNISMSDHPYLLGATSFGDFFSLPPTLHHQEYYLYVLWEGYEQAFHGCGVPQKHPQWKHHYHCVCRCHGPCAPNATGLHCGCQNQPRAPNTPPKAFRWWILIWWIFRSITLDCCPLAILSGDSVYWLKVPII